MKRSCVIFDIDGTLADTTHRLHHIQKQPKDWTGFFAAQSDDPLIQPIAKLCWSLFDTGCDIVLCSGRPADYREMTLDWLAKHHVPQSALYMRASGDFRDDQIIKRELLAELRNDGWEPWLVVDDRKRVVGMWREEGLTCLQCAPGDF